VTFGSKRAGTAEIAEAIAQELRGRGCDVDCVRGDDVASVAPYDAVVVGGGLYAFRWVREATRFVKRHAHDLRARPVWMFSSGPLDASAGTTEIPPGPGVRRLMARVGARSHATFGGRLERDARGFIASKMAEKHAGDWRDWDRIRGWARDIAGAVALAPRAAGIARPRPVAILLATLCLFTGVTAIGGGLALVAYPDGSFLHMPLSHLEHTPFASYLIPGLLLMLVVGAGALAAGLLALRRSRHAAVVGFAAGAALFLWTATEMMLLRSANWLQLGYLAIAVAMMAETIARPSRRPDSRSVTG
jgi:menaquinone-dependent protoporphyrinogen oxidase